MNSIQNKKELKLFAITWPIFIETLLRMLLGNLDTIMLSNYSENAVASVGAANQLNSIVVILFSIVATGTTIVISQYLGAGMKDKADSAAISALLINFTVGLLLSFVMFTFGRFILRAMNIPEELMADAVLYLRMVGSCVFLNALIATCSAILRSHGSTRPAMIVVLVMNIINALGNWFFLYSPVGNPVLGVRGVALATIISQAVAFVALVIIIARMGLKFSVKAIFHPDREVIGNVLKIGLPSAGENMVYQLSSLVITYIITFMGTEALTTRVMTFNLMYFIMIPGMSLGQGTQILVGHRVGAGRNQEAYKLCLRSLLYGVIGAILNSILIYIFRRPLLGIFSENPNIIATGGKLLALAIILEPGRVFNLVLMSSLKASGDVRFPVFMGCISPWIFAVGLSYLLGIHFGLGLIGVWIGYSVDEWFRGWAAYFRWKSRIWEQKALLRKTIP
ncbi:MAG: MATE family efflux transporter [Ruminiclostridium sp.]|nr:MATE family efflux transporter [Ruminiclostridium sp.]